MDPAPTPTGGKNRNLWTKVGFYSSLGFILPAAALAGFGFGWLIDQWLSTRPIFSLVFAMLGAAGGFWELLVLLKRYEKNGNSQE